MRGSTESGYAKLPRSLRKIEQSNPRSVVDVVVDDDHRFKYLFISFDASIRCFYYVRRVIVVDGIHLNGKYEGVLLVACAQDVVSDRLISIAKACHNVMPWATRGICYYHLQQNIISNFNGKQLMYLVKGAAYAHTHDDYNRYMASLTQRDRYNIKTSNIAESIKSMLKKAKGYPITYLIEFITKKLGRWYWKRREDALNLTTTFSRGVEYLLAVREHYADMMTVERIDGWRFQVRGGQHDCMVDLEAKSCSCGVFDVEKIPCSHAIKATKSSGWHMSTMTDHPYYRKDFVYASYAANIMPNVEHDPIGTDIRCIPPVPKCRPGRQKKSCWLTWQELSRKKGSKPKGS
ncbi:PREDICTED: uncharacterized protein LOC104772697 [Camelina sativa]|uniref:Uncharacterized protein LOC104772697 n=1 Tax=Camelina sativa TaxID=90675 RepID=A0ABM0Y4Z3_CAMSA|nr:PREDICTED: uncharacterized protein LOC104772697 [Camelina sativa]